MPAAFRQQAHTEVGPPRLGSGRCGAEGLGVDAFWALDVATQLFGAGQRLVARSEGSWHALKAAEHKPIGQGTLEEAALTPALQAAVVGSKVVLAPTTAKGIAAWADGTCSPTLASASKGQALLFGFMPGILYKGTAEGSSRYTDNRRDLVVKPTTVALGMPSVESSAKQLEVSRFDHATGIATTLNNFHFWKGHGTRPVVSLSIKTDRKIALVTASLAGTLKWRREADRIIVDLPLPQTVDVVVLR